MANQTTNQDTKQRPVPEWVLELDADLVDAKQGVGHGDRDQRRDAAKGLDDHKRERVHKDDQEGHQELRTVAAGVEKIFLKKKPRSRLLCHQWDAVNVKTLWTAAPAQPNPTQPPNPFYSLRQYLGVGKGKDHLLDLLHAKQGAGQALTSSMAKRQKQGG